MKLLDHQSHKKFDAGMKSFSPGLGVKCTVNGWKKKPAERAHHH